MYTGRLEGEPAMTHEHWRSTCNDIRRLLELAAKRVEQMSEEQKAELRAEILREWKVSVVESNATL